MCCRRAVAYALCRRLREMIVAEVGDINGILIEPMHVAARVALIIRMITMLRVHMNRRVIMLIISPERIKSIRPSAAIVIVGISTYRSLQCTKQMVAEGHSRTERRNTSRSLFRTSRQLLHAIKPILNNCSFVHEEPAGHCGYKVQYRCDLRR